MSQQENSQREIEVDIIRISDDYGLVTEFKCPECKEVIRVTQYGYSDECECGYKYKLSVTAVGYKNDC